MDRAPSFTQGVNSYFNCDPNNCGSLKQVIDTPGASVSSFVK